MRWRHAWTAATCVLALLAAGCGGVAVEFAPPSGPPYRGTSGPMPLADADAG